VSAPRLVDHGLWWELADLTDPPEPAWLEGAAAQATAAGALGLRVAAVRDPRPWAALGFRPLAEGAGELELALTRWLEGVEQTRELGRRLAGVLRPGDLVVLSGPLGAGKTALTQGIGAGLGVRGRVTSPTFVLAREHRGPVPLVHVDAYRVRDSGAADALADLDLEAALEDGVVVVEWGRGVVEGVADAWLDRRARPHCPRRPRQRRHRERRHRPPIPSRRSARSALVGDARVLTRGRDRAGRR
jgi:tRNA threonylcarbamoyladenosine biosynthesis protein TsaE